MLALRPMSLPTERDPAKNNDDDATFDRQLFDPDIESRAVDRGDLDPDANNREPDKDGVSHRADEADEAEEEELAYDDLMEIDDDTELRSEGPDA